MTKSKRRKLEKIKAPVTILRKPQQEKGNKPLGFLQVQELNQALSIKIPAG